jgi:hypothetical protein
VPYRDSKLTRILAHALGGNGRTSVVCCVSPAGSALDASRGTLLFAENAKRVVNFAEVNETVDDKVLLRQYQAEIAALRAQLASSAGGGNAGGVGGRALAALEQDFKAEQEARARAEKRLRGLELFILSSASGGAAAGASAAAAAAAAAASRRGRSRDPGGRRARAERSSWSPEATPRRDGGPRPARTISLGMRGASGRKLFGDIGDADDAEDGDSSDTDRSDAPMSSHSRLPDPLAQEIDALEAAGGARGAEAGRALAAEMRCLRIHTVVGLTSSVEEAELVARLQDELARLSAERAAGAAADEASSAMVEALRAEVGRLRDRASADRAADSALEALQAKLAASQADLDRYASALAEANARLAAEPPAAPTPPPPPTPPPRVMCEAACGSDEAERSPDATPAQAGSAGPGPGSRADADADAAQQSPRSHRLGARSPAEASPAWRGPRVLGGLLETWHRREGTPGASSPPPLPSPAISPAAAGAPRTGDKAAVASAAAALAAAEEERGGKENAPVNAVQPLGHAQRAAQRVTARAAGVALASPPLTVAGGSAATTPTGAWVPRADLEVERERRAADVRKLQACFAEAVSEGAAMKGHLGALRDANQRAEWQKKRLMAQVLKLEFAAEEASRATEALTAAVASEKARRRREAARRRDAEDDAAASAAAAATATHAAAAAAAAAGDHHRGWGDANDPASPAGGLSLTDSWAGPPTAAWFLPKILRLWALLHIPLLHRSRFFLGFRGRETFYFEAEHRRLAWLQASLRGGGRAHPLAGAAEALARERADLAKRLRKLAPEERARLFARFGVDAASKARKRALAAKLWAEPADAEHRGASAELVLRLHGLEPGQDLAVVFAPPTALLSMA